MEGSKGTCAIQEPGIVGVRDREFQIEAWQIEAHKLRGRIPI